MAGKTVSAIVPAYNEEKTVGQVVQTLLAVKAIDEVICVNDGSSDGTLKILRSFGDKIRLINFRKNRGKGRAVAAGIKEARGDFLLFCDADLINFSVGHVHSLLEPVLRGGYKACFGIPVIDNFGRPLNQRRLKNQVYLAGERVYQRQALLPYLDKLARTRGAGGSEVVLNTILAKKEVKVVLLPGLTKPSKEQKWDTAMAFKQYFLSAAGVLQEIARIEISSPSDLRKLENLLLFDARDNLENLMAFLPRLKNGRIKTVLSRYFRRYFNYFRRLKLKI